MSCLKFLSENLYNTAQVSLTVGTVNAQFPLANLKNESPSVKFRSIESTCVILVDLLQTRDFDSFALAGSPTEQLNIISAEIKTSTTTDFTMSTAIPIDLSSSELIGFKFFTEVSKRYVQVTLVSSVFCEVSQIFIGKSLELEQIALSIDSFSYQRSDQSSKSLNRYGQVFIDKLNQIKSLGGSIEFANKDEQEDLDDMFIRHGETLPIWMIVDTDNESMNDGKFKLTIYGYIQEMPTWSAVGGQLYNASISVKQAI